MKKILGAVVAVVLAAGLSAGGATGAQTPPVDGTPGTSSVNLATTFPRQPLCRWHTMCAV